MISASACFFPSEETPVPVITVSTKPQSPTATRTLAPSVTFWAFSVSSALSTGLVSAEDMVSTTVSASSVSPF